MSSSPAPPDAILAGHEVLPHPAPAGVTIYYWPCSLLLLAPSLILDRPTVPITATLRIACGKPYTIEAGGKQVVTRASLVAPKAERKRIIAMQSDIALFYLPLDLPEYAGLRRIIGEQSVVDLDIHDFDAFLPDIRRAMSHVLPKQEIKALVQRVVEAMTGNAAPAAAQDDPRVLSVCRLVDDLPLSQVRLDALAKQVHLSPSRLRELFKKQTGFTIGDYARWRSAWRAVLLWKRGLKLTDIAIEAGFHDLAHLDRTFNGIFGMNPSKVIDPAYVTLVNCE